MRSLAVDVEGFDSVVNMKCIRLEKKGKLRM